MPRVRVLEKHCKSCGLCISVCPKKGLRIVTSRLNEQGVHPAGPVAEVSCTGCGRCFLICPDAAIEIDGDTGGVLQKELSTRRSGE